MIGRSSGSSTSDGLPLRRVSRRRLSRRRRPGCISRRDRRATSLPSSTSIIAATDVIGFDIEYSRKMVSGVIGLLGRDVAHAEIFEIDRMAVLLDQEDGAGDFAGRDLVADIVADALEFCAAKSSARLRRYGGIPERRPRQRPPRQAGRSAGATMPRRVKPSVLHRFIDQLLHCRWMRWRSDGVCSSNTKNMSCLRSITK